jgi:hypothetical protein
MIALWLLTVVAFIAACLWLLFVPGWEPVLAVITTLVGLIALFVKREQDSSKKVKQVASGAGARAYQADGNIDASETHLSNTSQGPALQGQSLTLNAPVTQVGTQTIIQQGLDHSAVRDIALAVFFENFQKSRGQALELASSRAEKFTDQLINKLESESPDSLSEIGSPDFQLSLFEAQKGYARSGDEDLGSLLLKLLIDRSKQPQRNMMQLVLNESLETAPKLTDGSLATLSLIFLFKYTVHNGVINRVAFGEFLDREVQPLIPRMASTPTTLQYLEYTGCGNVGVGGINSRSLQSLLEPPYHAIFSKGINPEQLASARRELSRNYGAYFITCLNDSSRLQISFLNEQTLEMAFDRDDVPADDRTKLKSLFATNQMSEEEVLATVVGIRPYMSELFNVWNESAMTTFTLTSVGVAIAHSNLLRVTGHKSDLALWVN